MSDILLLAIGNTLLRDDGAGRHVLEFLKHAQTLPHEVSFLDGGTLSFALAADIERCHALLVLDAARFGAPPGTVRCFQGEVMDRLLKRPGRSVHEVGLADLLDMSRLTNQLPRRRALVGIEPEIVDWGETLSKPVAAAVPAAAQMARELIATWQAAEVVTPTHTVEKPLQEALG